MVVTDFAGLHSGSQCGKFRRDLRSGQRASRPDPGGHPEAPPDLGGRESQPGGQYVAHLDTGGQPRIVGPVDRSGDLPEHPVGQAAVGAQLGLEALGNLDAKSVAGQIGTSFP